MIISREQADQLISAGAATSRGIVNDDGQRYLVLDRHDVYRTDHALAWDDEQCAEEL